MLKPEPLSTNLVKLIVEAYKQGKKARDIAEDLGISKSTVWKHLRKLNVIEKARKGSPSLTLKEKEEIYNLYEKGYTARVIAKEFKVALSTVLKALKEKEDLEIRNRGPVRSTRLKVSISDKEKEQIRNLYENGLSITNIAKKTRFSYYTVHKVIESFGLQIRANSTYKMKPTSPLKASQIDGICADWLKGYSIHKLSLAYSLSREIIKETLLSKNIIPVHKKTFLQNRKKLSSEQTNQAVELCSKGHSSSEIAEKFDVSKSTIERSIKKATGLSPKQYALKEKKTDFYGRNIKNKK
jgi:transposase